MCATFTSGPRPTFDNNDEHVANMTSKVSKLSKSGFTWNSFSFGPSPKFDNYDQNVSEMTKQRVELKQTRLHLELKLT